MLMGDVAGGDIARRRWMEKDAGRKQQHINMESKKVVILYCSTLIFFVRIHLKNHTTNNILIIYILYSFPCKDIISMYLS